MSKIKHVSFDFWDTLYKPNPFFKKIRLNKIKWQFNISEPEILDAIKQTKLICDGLSEETLTTIPSITQHLILSDRLGFGKNIKIAKELDNITSKRFDEYNPIQLYNVDELNQIKQLGISISISCNTGLISGNSIIQMLDNNQIFDFILMSDNIGWFKPNPFFADSILNHPKCNATEFHEILHVGDNPDTDGKLCDNSGMIYFQNQKGSLDLDEIINFINKQ